MIYYKETVINKETHDRELYKTNCDKIELKINTQVRILVKLYILHF